MARPEPDSFAVSLPDLDLGPGRAAALVGPSGCGKTSLLQGLVGLDDALECQGQIRVLEQELPPGDTEAWRPVLAQQVLFLPQDAKDALHPLLRVGQLLRQVTGSKAKVVEEALARLLDEPGRIARAFPHQLSGGEAQRVLLALAHLRQPRLLIADEPTTGLDPESMASLGEQLRQFREAGMGLLLASHDRDFVEAQQAQVLLWRQGSFVPDTTSREMWPGRGDPPSHDQVVLEAAHLGKAFDDLQVLRDVSISLARGEVLAIVGRSGSGKTTLARLLAGLLPPDAGWVGRGRGGVQLLFQDAYATLTPHRTLRSLLLETARPGFDVETEAARLGMAGRLDVDADAMSAGECRRAALLRAMSVLPEVLILDEPTASLDPDRARQVVELLLDVQAQRRLSYILITHDRSLARAVAHRTLVLQEGGLCSE